MYIKCEEEDEGHMAEKWADNGHGTAWRKGTARRQTFYGHNIPSS